ncbi:MAG TPA: hypothetical protein VN281_02980, partial [Verrucomicrobiae bacterium]|nr:hypothetical protein [Verrucomicrobiae bacterium]
MQSRTRFLPFLLAFIMTGAAWAQQNPSPSAPPPAKAPAKKSPAASQPPPKPKSDDTLAETKDAALDPDAELQLAVRQAGNDSAALVTS